MNKTKIEWCDFTWNPVWGCLNNCPYCYARRLAHRFGESFEPHFKEKNFNRSMPKKPSRIFVNSMSEIGYWRPEWLAAVIRRIQHYPEHVFLFLTKMPTIYVLKRPLEQKFPLNCWLGITATTQREVIERQEYFVGPHVSFLSIEPMLGFVPANSIDIDMVDWIILGAETGNRKEKVTPKREWIEELADLGKPIFMKDSLKSIWGEDLITEFPKGME